MEINRLVRDKQQAGVSVNVDWAANAVKCVWRAHILYEVFIQQIKTQGVLHNNHGPTFTLAKLQMRAKIGFGK